MKKLVDNLNLIRTLGPIKALRFLNARRKFNPPKLEKSVKRDIAFQLGLKKHRLQNKIFRITRYATTFAVLGIFVSSIFSMPGDTFHAVKQKTEDVRAVVQPSFKEELKEIRDTQTSTPPVKETTSQEKPTPPKKKSTRVLSNLYNDDDRDDDRFRNQSDGSSDDDDRDRDDDDRDDDDDSDDDDDDDRDDDDDWDVRF